MRSSGYDRWVWLELIGFDNERDDVGVGEYLDNLGFLPDAVSILITSPDVIHLHRDLSETWSFPDDYCSYFGHRCNAERGIQAWTNQQLRRLVEVFHDHGVKVFLSTFTLFLNNKFSREFAGEHPELLETNADGGTLHWMPSGEKLIADYNFDARTLASVLPLKRFADGSLYEDFFVSRLSEVMLDYGFDGFHAADGWGPPRLPLSRGDYSDDMFSQFLDWIGSDIPDPPSRCDGDNSRVRERASWIRRYHWVDWIRFYADRWAGFHRKTAEALHGIDRKLVMNSAWTRDPFEALYRYGIDYSKSAAAGVDAFLTESAAGAADTEAGCGGRHHSFAAALALMSACLPDTKLLFLHGIKDTKEQWDLLRHAPTILEKEVYSLANLYRHTGGGLRRCASGLVGMLADGIRADEWRWLQGRWELAFGETPKRLMGASVVWSDAAMANEIADFVEHRGPTTHRLLHSLMEKGAPIDSIVRLEEINGVAGPIVVLNSHLLPGKELDSVLAYRNGSVITVGRNDEPRNGAHEYALQCVVHVPGMEPRAHVDTEGIASLPAVPAEIIDPQTWLDELVMRGVSDAFLTTCTRAIAEASGAVRVVTEQEWVRTLAMELEDGRIRLIIKNDSLFYALPILDTGSRIASIEVLTDFPCKRIEPDGSRFCIRVPGRGAVVVDLTHD